jgi:integrase
VQFMADNARTAKLTDYVVKAAAPETTRYVLWDSDKKGFGVRVEVSGVKSFLVRYRASGGGRNAPRRELVLGRFGNWTTADARKEAGRILNQVDAGLDPAMDLRSQRQEKSVAALCDLYLAEGIETKKASTIAIDKGRIERHIKPLLGNRLVSDVSADDIERFMRDVAKGKTAVDIKTKFRGRAIVEGGKGTASRTVGLLGGIFSFAVKRKMRPDNPVRGVKRYADKKGERFLTSQELTSLGEAVRTLEASGANAMAIAIIRLLTFTGARKSEITGLKWSEVDFERSMLRLGDSKTGAKVILLGPPALQILAGVARIEGKELVFPAESGERHFQGLEKVWRRVRAAAGMPDLRIHDLRHSYASAGLMAGDNLAVIAKLLGHTDVKTTARYAHLADDPVKQAAARIANSIAAAMNGKPSAEIVPLRKSK